MTKVFISQPMRGISDAKILVVREKLFNEYLADHPDAVLIDTTIPPTEAMLQVKHPSIQLLARSIGKMADADVVIFAKGWENYPGCRIENRVARYYDLQLIYA